MTCGSGHANLAHACVLVDGLAQQGLRHAVVCPGSRSTPIAVALAAHPDIHLRVHIDERSAAYFALGMARQLHEPIALLSTSGTAAANFLPAVAEASHSRIPLVVLTADRPPELRDWGAAQTIDQNHLYGSHAKWFADLPVPTGDDSLLRSTRATAVRAFQTSRLAPSGPVHLNIPYREPLLPLDLVPPLRLNALFAATRPAPAPVSHVIPTQEESLHGLDASQRRATASDALLSHIATLIRKEPRGIIVCGPGETPELPAAATALARASGYPILADPLSGLRFGPHDRTALIDSYDPFLRDRDTAQSLQPNLVLRLGAPPTSKPLQQFLAFDAERTHIVIDAGPPRDPSHLATQYVQGDEAHSLVAVAERLGPCKIPTGNPWLAAWKTADRVTREAIGRSLDGSHDLSEGGVAADFVALLPDGSTLVAGNSMPIRDVDAFVRGNARRLRLRATRGANGFAGINTPARGAAAAADGPVALLVGDLSFLHDLGGLVAARLFDLSAVIVVINNNGGGIFSFLPQAEQLDAPTFEALFGTPANIDIAAAARLFSASYARPLTRCAFRRDVHRALAGKGLSIVEVVTDRSRNVTQHREVWATVAAALQNVATYAR